MNHRSWLRVSLRSLLLAIGLLAIGLAGWTQLGMATATFEVWQNDLLLDDNGQVVGDLLCGYTAPGGDRQPAWPFRFEIHGIVNSDLIALRTGSQRRIRFRQTAFWPFSKQDPFQRYIENELGIDRGDIVGFVMTDQATNVMINGR